MYNATTITVDRETKERLESIAGKRPMARFLRELSLGLSGQLPDSLIEALENVKQQVSEFQQLYTTGGNNVGNK